VEVVEYLSKELHLLGSDVELQVVEPHVRMLPSQLKDFGGVSLVDTEAALACDLILMLVDHEEFFSIPSARLAGKTVIDTRGVWRTRSGWAA